jgi:hypothetical protein
LCVGLKFLFYFILGQWDCWIWWFCFLSFFLKSELIVQCVNSLFSDLRFSRTLLVHFVIIDWNPNGPQMCFHRPCLCLDNNFINRYLKFLSSCSLLLLLLLGPPGSITSTSLCLLWPVLCIEFLFDKFFCRFLSTEIFGKLVFFASLNLTNFAGQIFNITKLLKYFFLNEGVCHAVALSFTLKSLLSKRKNILWKFKYFTMQKYNLQKIL